MVNYTTSLFIGETSRGVPKPLMHDSHSGIFNNRPPGTLITGAPGSGKTFLALTLAAISAILGKTTIVLDPKGDFLSLITIKEELGDIKLWNLSGSKKRKKGFLDPFYLADTPGEQLELVISVISMFLGGLSPEQLTALTPIIKDVIEEDVPSLIKVVNALNISQDRIANQLGTHLGLISKLPYADVCFAPGGSRQSILRLDSGTTIITMPGLELAPVAANSAAGATANKKRLSATIFYLVTDYIRRVMNDDTSARPKTLIIDEAWAVVQSPEGSECIKEVAKLGRSKRLALILITQNNKEIEELDITNTISTRFAFRTDKDEAKDIIRSMQLPEGEGYESVIVGLNNGECLMQDWRERSCVTQITDKIPGWKEAFNNNPYFQNQKSFKTNS